MSTKKETISFEWMDAIQEISKMNKQKAKETLPERPLHSLSYDLDCPTISQLIDSLVKIKNSFGDIGIRFIELGEVSSPFTNDWEIIPTGKCHIKEDEHEIGIRIKTGCCNTDKVE